MRKTLLKILLVIGAISFVYLSEILFLFHQGSLDTFGGWSSWFYLVILSFVYHGPYLLIALFLSTIFNRYGNATTNSVVIRILSIFALLKSILILLNWANDWQPVQGYELLQGYQLIGIAEVYLVLISIMTGILFQKKFRREPEY